MRLLIDYGDHAALCDDPDLLDAAEELVIDLLGEDDPLEAPIERQGTLCTLERYEPHHGQLALLCAEACGCTVFVEDSADPTGQGASIELVGTIEDAEAARRTYRKARKLVERAANRACRSRSAEWRARWMAEHIEQRRDDVERLADQALAKSYREKAPKGVTLVWDDPETDTDPEDRAEQARAWMHREMGCDQLAVLPPALPESVVDLAAFAARSRS